MLSISRIFKLLLLPPALYPYFWPLLKGYILEKAKPNTELGFLLLTILSPKERQETFNMSATMLTYFSSTYYVTAFHP